MAGSQKTEKVQMSKFRPSMNFVRIFCDKALDHQAKEVLGFSLKTNIDEIDAAEVHAKFIATVIAANEPDASTDTRIVHEAYQYLTRAVKGAEERSEK